MNTQGPYKKRIVKGPNVVKRRIGNLQGTGGHKYPPSSLNRTVKCRCLNAAGLPCGATFVPDEDDYFREKHERDFHT